VMSMCLKKFIPALRNRGRIGVWLRNLTPGLTQEMGIGSVAN
jgi:hypothetical protein